MVEGQRIHSLGRVDWFLGFSEIFSLTSLLSTYKWQLQIFLINFSIFDPRVVGKGRDVQF